MRPIDAHRVENLLQMCGSYHGVIAYDTVISILHDVPTVDVPDTNVGDMISRQAAINAIVNTVSEIGLHDNSEVARYGATFRQHEIIDIIECVPSAEPEIIRCKDCKHYDGRPCGIVDWYNTADDFCSKAERRNE